MTHPEICMKLFRVLGDIIVDLQQRLEEKIMHTTSEQIIMLLLRLAKSNSEEVDAGMVRITTKFTNRELSNMIGSSRETVSRTLTQLHQKDRIKTNAEGFIVFAPDLLEEEIFS